MAKLGVRTRISQGYVGTVILLRLEAGGVGDFAGRTGFTKSLGKTHKPTISS